MTHSYRGELSAVIAFVIWGLLPIFWKQLHSLSPLAIVSHRTLWGMILLLFVMGLRRQWEEIIQALRCRRTVAWLILSGMLLAGNWLLYIWATLNDRILEGALGYYLNPFFNMLFGYLWFGERHNRMRLLAIATALGGVALQFPAINGLPWIALSLAMSFSLYAVIKKRTNLSAVSGLSAETILLCPFAIGWLMLHPSAAMPEDLGSVNGPLLLLAIGSATVLPLLLFGHAARSIPLATLGILQFIGPTIQFAIGWFMYDEPMSLLRLSSFGLIWIAIGIYAFDTRRKS